MTPPPDDPRAPRRPSRPGTAAGWAALALAVAAIVVLLAIPFVGAATGRVEGLLSSNTQVRVSSSATVLEPGDRACVRGVYVPDGARVVRVYPGYVAERSPTLRFTVRGDGGRVVAGRATRFATGEPLLVDLGPLPTSASATVCVHNRGPSGVSLAEARGHFGAAEARPPIRVGILSGDHPRAVALVDDALERAGLFKSGIVTPALIVLLGLAVLVGVVGALVLVLRDEEGPSS